MEEGLKPESASEAMSFGLLEYADRLGRMMTSARDSLAEQIGNLQELQKWAIASVQGMQQHADTAIQKLDAERQRFEAERGKLQNAQVNFERSAVLAIQNAVGKHSVEIEGQINGALRKPLGDIERAAGQLSQNVKDTKWLTGGSILALGMVLGFLIGYLPLRRDKSDLQQQMTRIEQSLTALQQQVAVTPVAPDPHPTAHKVKAK